MADAESRAQADGRSKRGRRRYMPAWARAVRRVPQAYVLGAAVAVAVVLYVAIDATAAGIAVGAIWIVIAIALWRADRLSKRGS